MAGMSIDIVVTHEGVTYSAQVATIEGTHLGPEDHGMWTANLTCVGVGWGQGAGGYSLDTPADDERFNRRIGTAFGMDQIIAIVEAVGCGKWERLPGSRCLILRDGTGGGWSGTIKGIADINAERVLIFAAHAAQWHDPVAAQ